MSTISAYEEESGPGGSLHWKELRNGHWLAAGLGGRYDAYPEAGGGYRLYWTQNGTASPTFLGKFDTLGGTYGAGSRHETSVTSRKEQKAAECAGDPSAMGDPPVAAVVTTAVVAGEEDGNGPVRLTWIDVDGAHKKATYKGTVYRVTYERRSSYRLSYWSGDGHKEDVLGVFPSLKSAQDAARAHVYGKRRSHVSVVSDASEEKSAFRWTEVSFDKREDAEKFAKLMEKVNSTIVAHHDNLIVRTNATHGDITRVLTKHNWKAGYRLGRNALAAEETVPVIHEAAEACVPWVKVTRDPERYNECLTRAKKIGPITTPRAVYDLLADALAKEDQEVFLVVMLDIRGQLRGVCEIARGQRSKVTVSPADILRPVLIAGAEGCILVHQHPSGKCDPSEADRQLTKSVRDCIKPYGSSITLADHVVIGSGEFYSIAENKKYKS